MLLGRTSSFAVSSQWYGAGNIQEFAYVQYIEVAIAVSGVDRELGCVCRRWTTADEVDMNLFIEQSLCGNQVEQGEYYGRVPFSSLDSTPNAVRSNKSIALFSDKLQ